MSPLDAGQAGKERLARWVGEHARAVRGYILGMVRRADLADDILQEVFQRAWQAQDRYRDEGHERAYLLRIADRLVIDHSRRRRQEVNIDATQWSELEPEARTEGALDKLARTELSGEIAAALDQLTHAQQRVLLLRYFGDLSFEEISATLGCPLGTALSHCRRGLAALKKLLVAKT